MTEAAGCPHEGGSLIDLEGVDPYPTLARMRKEGPMRFDSGLGAWVAQSYEACQFVFRNDKTLFIHPDGDPDSDYKEVSQGRRHPKTLDGEEHTRMHQWLVQRFSPRQTGAMRETVIRIIINDVINRFAARGKADLTADFADNIPIRVIASVIDLPWDDLEWVGKVKGALDQIGAFYNKRMTGDKDLTARTKHAFDTMRELLNPTIEARRDGTGDDIVSQMWRDGPNLLPCWNEEDIFINITTVFIGGYDTTTMGISNAFKLLLDDLPLMEEIRITDDSKLKRFVEESLRLLPPVQYRARRARADTEVCGQPIKKGEFIIPMLAAANRDADQYPCPNAIDLNRKGAMNHLTFIAGPRMCAGAGLARTEIFEAVRTLLQRLPDLRHDPDAPEPDYAGLVLRRYYPLHVTFTSEEKGGEPSIESEIEGATG